MTKSKAAEFTSEENAIADFFKVLSHPARIAILKALADRGECVCGELVSELPLAQSTVSQHLKQLRDSGFVKGEIEGTKSCYCLDKKKLASFFVLFSRFQKKLEKSLSQLEECC